jgi:hypothetical protein
MTAPLYAFDGAGPFDLAAAKAHGGIAATTYIRGTPGGMPHADAARVAEIRTDGLGASPNWEATADYFGTCSLAGATWAGTDALRACRELGYPDDGTIAVGFSFDFDVPAGRYPEMGAKARAITAALGGHYRTMIYGQESLIIYLVVHGDVTGKHWLMMSRFGQAYDPGASYFCMVQGHDVGGNWINSPVPGTDINTVTDPHALYAWWETGSPYEQGDSPMTPYEIQQIAAASAKATVDEMFTRNIAGTSNHPLPGWITLINANVSAVLAAVKAQTGVTLSDADVAAIADRAAAAMLAKAPTYTGTLPLTLTPMATP